MGFGTLFFGYFLLLNIVDFFLTDLVMALILLLASYKLSSVSTEFKKAGIASAVFAVLALAEFVIRIISMLTAKDPDYITSSLITIVRYIFVGLIAFLIMLGIEKLARELEIKNLGDRARNMKIANTAVYSLSALLNIPSLDKLFGGSETAIQALAITGVVLLLISFAVTAISLTAIYGAYMHICMPEDLVYKEKPSRFGFVNRYRKYEEKKNQEYIDYKIQSMNKQDKKNKKK